MVFFLFLFFVPRPLLKEDEYLCMSSVLDLADCAEAVMVPFCLDV